MARLAIQRNPINESYQRIKKKESKRNLLSFLIALFISLYLYLRNFSQEHVFATLGPILKNVTSEKLNRGRNIVKTR